MFAEILEAVAEDAGESDFAHDVVRDRWNVGLYKPPLKDGDDL